MSDYDTLLAIDGLGSASLVRGRRAKPVLQFVCRGRAGEVSVESTDARFRPRFFHGCDRFGGYARDAAMVDVEDLQDVGLHLRGRLDPLLGLNPDAVDAGLDAKSQALVCLAGLHALGASDATYQWYVSQALAAGCTQVEVVGTLIAVGALVGEARAVSAARPLALALGHDIESIVEGANGRDIEGAIGAEGACGSPPGSGGWRR